MIWRFGEGKRREGMSGEGKEKRGGEGTLEVR